MGTYYGVEEVIKRGTPIEATRSQPRILSDERLVAVVFNGVKAIAPDVTDPEDYNEFYGQYSEGWQLSIGIFRLPKNEVENCPDMGWLKTFDDPLKAPRSVNTSASSPSQSEQKPKGLQPS